MRCHAKVPPFWWHPHFWSAFATIWKSAFYHECTISFKLQFPIYINLILIFFDVFYRGHLSVKHLWRVFRSRVGWGLIIYYYYTLKKTNIKMADRQIKILKKLLFSLCLSVEFENKTFKSNVWPLQFTANIAKFKCYRGQILVFIWWWGDCFIGSEALKFVHGNI